MTLWLEADTERRFEATRYPAMKVGHLGEDSPLREVGLRQGDIVIAIDGEAFSDTRPTTIVWKKLTETGSVRLTVERGEERGDIGIEKAQVPRFRDLPLRAVLGSREP